MKKLLDIKKLNVTFQTQGLNLHAVRGINFSLFEGESVGIVGESGCGKSAAAKSLIKLLPYKTAKISGEIWFKDKNLVAFSETEMQRIRGKDIGMIFQDTATSLNPTLKMGFQIIEGYRKHFPKVSQKQAKEITCEMLNKVGMAHPEKIMSSYPYMLSGGMRQRAMIALTLACKPEILLADEPTTALDVITQMRILNLLKQYQAETKIGIVLITHDMRLIAQFCERVIVMYAGMIVETANVHELFNNPQHPYTKGLINAIPRLDHSQKNRLISIEGNPPNLTLPLNYCGFCCRCCDSMNICATSSPVLTQITDTHWSACFKNDPKYNKKKAV